MMSLAENETRKQKKTRVKNVRKLATLIKEDADADYKEKNARLNEHGEQYNTSCSGSCIG